jgi:hypothetical protein
MLSLVLKHKNTIFYINTKLNLVYFYIKIHFYFNIKLNVYVEAIIIKLVRNYIAKPA